MQTGYETKIIPIIVITFIIVAILNLSLAIFIYSKRIKNNIHKYLTLSALFSGLFAIPYAVLYFKFPNPSLLWAKFAYIGTFILPNLTLCLFYFFEDLPTNIKIKKFLVYFPAYFIFVSAVVTPFVVKKVIFHNYSVIGITGPLDYVARLYYMSIMLVICYYLLKVYNKASGKKKLQIKYFLLGTFIYMIGGGTSVVIMPLLKKAAVYTEFGPLFSFFWILLITYAIIRYKLLEIDTVIHRTFLWIATSLWLLTPGYFLFKYARYFLQSLSTLWLTISALGLFYLFLWYYRYFQPRIDHLFRRRKYDYQAILAKVSEKIATTINIEDLNNQLLSEVCETMYLRNGLLYIMDKEEAKFSLIGKRGYKETNEINYNQVEITSNTSFFKWLLQHQEVLEKEQILVNPRYAQIKQDVIKLFAEHELELMVPLVLENKVNGLLGLGKKENLQPYSLKDTELLKKLGQETGVTVYNALHYRDLLEKDRLEEEMKLGREIQMALLPKKSPQIKNLSISGLMLPAKEIGGDYYDFITLPQEDELGIAIADVSGKGVGAGLIMATVKATLKGLSQQRLSPKQILNHTNNLIYEYTIGQKFITMLYFQYKAKESALYYSSAGHEHILIYHNSSKSIESVMSGGFMLGMIPDIEAYLEEHKIVLEQKDKILLYTDGVTEAENPSGDRFGLERLKESFKAHSDKIPFELIQAVKAQVYEFIDTQPQYDDITLVGMEAG